MQGQPTRAMPWRAKMPDPLDDILSVIYILITKETGQSKV
jgi:hypothetical protein